MGINVRTLLPFLLFYFLKDLSAQTVHNVVTYTSKLEEELNCIFTSTVVQWTALRDDGLAIRLFLYDITTGFVQKQTNDSKYDNFNYAIEGINRFNLVINNVDQGDGGRYLCNPITSTIVTFDVTVEVLPESININCMESNVCMPSAGKETPPGVTCVCTANGVSSSQLGIEWHGFGITFISDTVSGSSSISSEVTLWPPSGIFGISCSLTGYRSQIPERLISYNYTFSPPVCTLTSDCSPDGTSASLICSCSKGSPVVYGYSFYNSQKSIIGTQLDSSLKVDSDKKETFYCKGCNGVLHDEFVSHALNCNQAKSKAWPWWIFIIFGILLLLVVVAIIFLVKKGRKKPSTRKLGIQHEESTVLKSEISMLWADLKTRDVEGGHIQVERPDNKNRSAGSSGVPNVGPGKVEGPQNNATNENVAQKKPPIPKKRGENNMKSKEREAVKDEERRIITCHIPVHADVNKRRQRADNKTITNGEDSPNQAPLSTERTQGDGRADTDTQHMLFLLRPSQTDHGKEPSVDCPSEKDVLLALAPGFL